MMNLGRFTERRKEKRFKLNDAVFVVMHLPATKMCRVIDIGRGGLAVEYAGSEKRLNELDELDIFKPDFSFYVENIKAETISETEVSDTAQKSNGIRRSGIRFRDLSADQISQLENFFQTLAA